MLLNLVASPISGPCFWASELKRPLKIISSWVLCYLSICLMDGFSALVLRRKLCSVMEGSAEDIVTGWDVYVCIYIYEFEYMSILYEIILYYFEIFVQNVNCRCTVLFMEYIIKWYVYLRCFVKFFTSETFHIFISIKAGYTRSDWCLAHRNQISKTPIVTEASQKDG